MWLDVAKTLNVNGKIRIQCCRDDNSMIVGRTASKFWCYCHRCKESRSVSVGLRSIKDIINDKRLLQELKTQSPQNRLPKLTEIPADAAVWYLKYGISNADVSKYGIGYSQKYKRVCIPLAQNAGMQMRAVYPYQEPKYLNVELKPNAYKSLVFDTGRHKGDKITICVEDVLSAIKIRKAGYHAIALIGTNVRGKWNQIQQHRNTIVSWFDSDAAGKHAYTELHKLCELTGTRFQSVHTEHDPKVYTQEEIQRIINGID
jgi:hypothetical protein